MNKRHSLEKRTKVATQKYLVGRQLDMPTTEERAIFRDWFNSITTSMDNDELRKLLIFVYSEIFPDALVLEVLTRPSLIDVKTTKRLVFKEVR